MGKKTVETTASGLNQFIGKQGLAPLDTEEVTELGQYFPSSGGDSGFEPTEAQLEAMNSGITAAKVAAYDAIEGISSPTASDSGKVLTASGADTYGWAELPSVDEVPDVTSSDDGKVLTAAYSGGTGTYAWTTAPTTAPLTGEYIIPNNQGERIDHIYYGTPTNVGLSDTFALYTETNQVQTGGLRLAAAIGSNHKLYFKFKPYNESYGDWIALDIDALSNYSAAPTAYTAPTYNTTYVDTTSDSTSGGYVVINNICYVNIRVKLKSIPSSTSTYTTIATGLPKPLLSSVKVYVDIGDTGPGFAQIDRYGNSLMYKKGSDANAGNIRNFNVSYLIDTST